MIDGNIDVVSLTGDITDSVSLEGELLPIGPKGDKGDPGFSPVVTTSKIGKTTTVKFETATGNVYAYIQDGEDGQGSGDMLKEVYDANNNGIVDNAEKVNNHTVEKDVPANADFSDTKAIWGNITGTLANQTDLNTALGNKANTSDLSTVATSGSYNDLSNKPTNVSTFTNDANYVTSNGNAESTQTNVSNATFTNTLEAPMNIDLKGNTLQNGTPTPSSPIPINNVSGDNDIVVCGKNLINKNNYRLGYYDSSGNWNNANNNATFDLIQVVPNTTYTFSTNANTDNKNFVEFGINKNFITRATTSYNTKFKTITTSQNTYYISLMMNINNQAITQSDIDNLLPQLEQNNETTTYEAYNGTTYNIDLPVENLFNKNGDFTYGNDNYKTSLNAQGQIVSTSNYASKKSAGILIEGLEKNTTYSMSGILVSANGTNTGDNANIDIRSGDNASVIVRKYFSSTLQKPNNFSFTINTGNYTSIWISFNGSNSSETGDTITIFDNIQLEKGSKSNSYTPYGTTPIELNKIGTYQDYIYKDNDKWYLHKEIGKYTFTGEENFTWDSDKQRIIIPISNLGINTPPLTTSQPFNVYNQKAIGTTFDNLYNKVVDNCFALSTGNSISIRSTSFDNLNTGKSTIANTDLYYILQTPTNTEITYASLINQLESIKNAMSKEGTTNVNQVNNDLPFMLDLSLFNNNYNGRYEGLKEQVDNNTSDIDAINNYVYSKDVISIIGNPNYTISSTGAYEKVPLNIISSQIGNNFSLNNSNQIVCKKKGYIKINANINYTSINTSGVKWAGVFINNNNTITTNSYGVASQRITLSITTFLIKVNANDVIDIRVYGNQGDIIRNDNLAYTYLTCEYV